MTSPSDAREAAGLHALFWLVAANAVGVWMALLLLLPELNDLLAPLTFGRFVPLHLDFHLYGWLSFPLIALLFQAYGRGSSRWEGAAVWAWSNALVFGGAHWLMGQSSGKLFLEWSPYDRKLMTVAMVLLWLALANGYYQTRALHRGDWLRPLGLMLLAAVPVVFYISVGIDVYPPINPNSGGATGSSLLGSTLGIVSLFLLTPYLVAARQPAYDGGRWLWGLWLLHLIGFGLAGHGDRRNDEWPQIAALGSLLIWVPLLWRHYRRFDWVAGSAVWLTGAIAWGALLTVSGWIAFLPGVLDRWKFSHALVAHAHLAMAGLLTSFVVLILLVLAPRLAILRCRTLAGLWQGGLAVHLFALMALSELEARQPLALFNRDALASALMGLRLLAGGVMLAVSVLWFWQGLRSRRPPTAEVVDGLA